MKKTNETILEYISFYLTKLKSYSFHISCDCMQNCQQNKNCFFMCLIYSLIMLKIKVHNQH